VKAKFNDRTIIRLMSDCEIIRILNSRGDELLFNIQHPNQSLFNEYGQYIKLTQEFLEYAFMSEKDRKEKVVKQETEKSAIDGEIQRINRTV